MEEGGILPDLFLLLLLLLFPVSYLRGIPYMTSSKFSDFVTPPSSLCPQNYMLFFSSRVGAFLDSLPLLFCWDVIYGSTFTSSFFLLSASFLAFPRV